MYMHYAQVMNTTHNKGEIKKIKFKKEKEEEEKKGKMRGKSKRLNDAYDIFIFMFMDNEI